MPPTSLPVAGKGQHETRPGAGSPDGNFLQAISPCAGGGAASREAHSHFSGVIFPTSEAPRLLGELSSEACRALTDVERSGKQPGFPCFRVCLPVARGPKATTGPTDVGQSGKIYIATWDVPQIQGNLAWKMLFGQRLLL